MAGVMSGQQIPVEIERLVRSLFQRDARSELEPLAGGASDRWYLRMRGPAAREIAGSDSLVVMGVAPGLLHALAAYSSVQDFLQRHGVRVPTRYLEWPDSGVHLIEDLGNTTLTEALGDPSVRDGLHQRAVGLLAVMHDVKPEPGDPCTALRLHFDEGKWLFEFGFHVRRWLIDAYYGVIPTPGERTVLETAWRWISRELAAQPRVFTHRDYQSSNLMVLPDGSLAVIDFQDARMGFAGYDLASLLWDSYTTISDDERAELIGLYLSERHVGIDRVEFDRLLRVAAIQRKLHDVGAFAYTAFHRGKTSYLQYIPGTMRVVIDLMESVDETRDASAVLVDLSNRSGR